MGKEGRRGMAGERRWAESEKSKEEGGSAERDVTDRSESRNGSDSVLSILLSLEAVEDDEADFLSGEEDSQELPRREGVRFLLSLRGAHSRCRDSSEVKDPRGRPEGTCC